MASKKNLIILTKILLALVGNPKSFLDFASMNNIHSTVKTTNRRSTKEDKYGGQFDRVAAIVNQMDPLECLSSDCLKTIVFLESTLTESTLRIVRHVVRRPAWYDGKI
eukprot:13008577-Ditylum_brightwellii.AAC.1